MRFDQIVHEVRGPTSWDLRMCKQADEVATWSKDPSTKVGAVLMSPDHQQIVVGYNGYPANVSDQQLVHSREQRLSRTIHAELNAILLARRDLQGYTMYVSPFLPCDRCAVNIAQMRIKEVKVQLLDRVALDRWLPAFLEGAAILREANIPLVGLR